jgi:outer membrane protein OmpA-like peptidoglycan-associated protein
LVLSKTFFAVADIHFDLDQSAIRSDAIPILDKLVYMMMEHPEISLATTSYSDTRYAKYNEKLALSRAQAANNYLESKGISKDRLSVEKHGRSQVANPCNDDPSCSLATQQLNRKTEFNVVYNGVNLGQIN